MTREKERSPVGPALLAALTIGASAHGSAAQAGAAAALAQIGAVLSLLALAKLVFTELRRGRAAERVLLLGAGPLARRLLREIKAMPDLGFTVVGVIEDETSAESLRAAVEARRPSRIVVGERRGMLPMDDLLEMRGSGVAVEDVASFYERVTGKLPIETLTPSTLIFGDGFRSTRLHRAAARVLSLLAGVCGLVAGAPLFALIAFLIKLESRGPVLFVHKRVGLGGLPFDLFKFRTMRVAQGPTSEWVRDNAARITRVGAVLRRFRLDELPQCVNLVRGDMNLVGPRPHPLSNYTLFAERIPFYALRALVPPGLTGWAQVKYRYANDLEEETEKMRYDLYYIKHRSLLLDLLILPATLMVVLTHAGSEAPASGSVDAQPAPAPAMSPGPGAMARRPVARNAFARRRPPAQQDSRRAS